jgi:hypothetical protein
MIWNQGHHIIQRAARLAFKPDFLKQPLNIWQCAKLLRQTALTEKNGQKGDPDGVFSSVFSMI